MNKSAAIGHVLERLRDTDPEQFEFLCMGVIEEIEDPAQIELTPLRQDGGIDIQGKIGKALLNGEFGIQVKQTERTIGAPLMREFAGALEVDASHFGTFITTSDFSKNAIEEVDETDPFSIALISGEELAELMVRYEQGVIQQSEEQETYVEDTDFWGEFKIEEDLISSGEVPQADNLDILHEVVAGVSSGHQYKPEVAEWLTTQTDEEWTRRQADYYAIAAHAIGLLDADLGEYSQSDADREVRKWTMTPEGDRYLELTEMDPLEAREYLYDLIRELEIVEMVIEKAKENAVISQTEIADVIREETTVSGSTAGRRAKTIGGWLGAMNDPIKRLENGEIRYMYQPKDLSDY